MQETIEFNIDFLSKFWDKPPMVEIAIDNQVQWRSSIDKPKLRAEFSTTLDFDKPHQLKIIRSNKTDAQCKISEDGQIKDQYIIIDRVTIDGVDIQNLIWHRCWYEPEYPNLWRQEQESQGVTLEQKVIGETWLSHNGTWFFDFSSPFYKFVISQFRE